MFSMITQLEKARAEIERSVSASPSPVPPESEDAAIGMANGPRHSGRKSAARPAANLRTGRWTLDEKLLFLYGLRKYGKGRWKKISIYLPNRSLVQIKSHAQKVIKRHETGEDVFLRLDENMMRTETLVAEIHENLQIRGISIPPAQPINVREKKTRVMDAREQIVAASALCQLSQPTSSALSRADASSLHVSVNDPTLTIRQIVLGTSMSTSNVVKL